jgi:hypothetical protein
MSDKIVNAIKMDEIVIRVLELISSMLIDSQVTVAPSLVKVFV